ncbi:transcription initiation factor TFIID subunit 11-like [Mya arenaria]|uniref:transcription initiation factor TFIID subunit 11-like n=1 Tax=Mya arenaria TaxID=6604 RepID=UPI0022E200B6|nr:transcription initiation factor TFIID subunit 11-like [Mya arenaria]
MDQSVSPLLKSPPTPGSSKESSQSDRKETSSKSPRKTQNSESDHDTETETPEKAKAKSPAKAKSSPSADKKRKAETDEEIIAKHAKQEEERLKMQVLVSNFSEDQLNRYEMYRRAAFPKASIKRFMQSITGSAISPNVVIAMAGISKVFVGELVEEALDVLESWGDTGPIQPKHIREAVRILRERGTVPNSKKKKVMFS